MFLMINVADVASVLFLVLLEGVLSLDNAVVLALTVKHLPDEQQRRALTFGIWGAFIFRFLALVFLTTLIHLTWIKVLAGAYLVWVGLCHFFVPENKPTQARVFLRSFWGVVLTVELMDIAFSLDSIFAAVAISQEFWIVFLGGLMGIVMMRFAAQIFVKLLEKFPILTPSAYILVMAVGFKLSIQTLLKG